MFSTLKVARQTPLLSRFIRQYSNNNNNESWKILAEKTEKYSIELAKAHQAVTKAHQAVIKEKDKILQERDRVNNLRRNLESIQGQFLRLKGNFNLRGALEFSLDAYRVVAKINERSNEGILKILVKSDPDYNQCLETTLKRYQLRKKDVNSCATVMYHELSKYAHGNEGELCVRDTERPMTDVAALEAIFCALKKKDCFHLPLKIIVDKTERDLE